MLKFSDLSQTEQQVYITRMENQLKIEKENLAKWCPEMPENDSDKWICYKVLEKLENFEDSEVSMLCRKMKNHKIDVEQDEKLPNILWDNVYIENVS